MEIDKTTPIDSSFVPPAYIVENYRITEASGLVASRLHNRFIWTHNDSGHETRIFLINEEAQLKAQFRLDKIKGIDTEDIAMGKWAKDSLNYIFLGDIGDNYKRRNTKTIYYFPEPAQFKPKTENDTPLNFIKDVQTIHFKYPNGNVDAETLLFDPIDKSLLVISKENDKAQIFAIDLNKKDKEFQIAQKIGELSLNWLTAGDISVNGDEILLKNYANIYYWKRKPQETLAQLFKRQPKKLLYFYEPQGEAIAWRLDGSGFFTLSEKNNNTRANLFFFARKNVKQ